MTEDGKENNTSCLKDRKVNRDVNVSSLDRERVWILFVLEERLTGVGGGGERRTCSKVYNR